MQLFVKTLTGKTITVNTQPEHTVMDIMQAIESQEGTPPIQQRLIFAGQSLFAGRSLKSYKIKNEATLHMVLRLRGMISDFDESISDCTSLEWKEYLFGYRKEMPNDIACLEALAKEKQASRLDSFFSTTIQIPLAISQELIAFMDRVHEKNERSDLKILFENMDAFCELRLESPEKLYEHLCKLHSSQNRVSIALRRTEKTKGCISFHCDGGYATKTVQVCLNSDTEYEGGRLLFFAQGKCFCPKREKGFVSIHNRDILHAVTSLRSGIRYSLFVVDKANTLGKSVVRMDDEAVKKILANDTDGEVEDITDACLAEQEAENKRSAIDLTSEPSPKRKRTKNATAGNSSETPEGEEGEDTEWWQPEAVFAKIEANPNVIRRAPELLFPEGNNDPVTCSKCVKDEHNFAVFLPAVWRSDTPLMGIAMMHSKKHLTKSRWTMEKLIKLKSHFPNLKVSDEHWSTYPHWSLHHYIKNIIFDAEKCDIQEALRFVSLFCDKKQLLRVLGTEQVVKRKDIVHTLKGFKMTKGLTRRKSVLIECLVDILYGESLHQHQERNE